jgi:hypothetical protein
MNEYGFVDKETDQRYHRPTIPKKLVSWYHRPTIPKKLVSWYHRPAISKKLVSWYHRPTISKQLESWYHRPIPKKFVIFKEDEIVSKGIESLPQTLTLTKKLVDLIYLSLIY